LRFEPRSPGLGGFDLGSSAITHGSAETRVLISGEKAKRLAGYGVGDFGLNIYWHSLSLLLTFWYVEVVGLDPKVAGWIYALGLLWDAISDPVIASMAASNRSRYGTYRPFLLFGSVLLGASFSLLFWRPPLEGVWLLVALVGAGITFRTSYTLVAVPYSALSARLTFNSDERAELSGVRMFFAFCGMLCVMTLAFPLSRALGDGGADYSSAGFFFAAIVGAVFATCALVACFVFTKERLPPGQLEVDRSWNLDTFVRAFRSNAALRSLMVLLLLNSAAGAILSISMLFYITANAQTFAQKEVILTAYGVATLAGTPIWTVLTRSAGKRKCWVAATAVFAVAGLWLYAQGPVLVAGVPVQILALGFANAAFAIIIWALIPDAVEYGQHAYGGRDEGAVFGSSLLVQKASGGLTGLGVGYLLSAIGYQGDRDAQSVETARALGDFISIVPAALLICASIALLLMPLTRDLHARIVDELSR